jgi:decaprenylphospho-beta-D-erythro-pentofuranosid-2-ulose 2-reductase
VIDALGEPQSLAVLGGSSEIALAVATRLAAGRTRRVVLAGRDAAALEAARAAVERAGATDVRTVGLDAADTSTHDATVAELFADGDVDVVLLAFGLLGDQAESEADPDRAVEIAEVNYVGALSLGLRAANALRRQGHGTLVVLSSVAGERARRSNFVYGSSKAGLDVFAQGLGDSLQGSGVHVVIVRPGFVRTKMTAGLPDAPMATTPEAVADAVVKALRTGREIVWVPGQMRVVMSGLRHLPRPVFRRLKI